MLLVVLVELVLVVMIAIANKNIDQLHMYIRYTVAVYLCLLIYFSQPPHEAGVVIILI